MVEFHDLKLVFIHTVCPISFWAPPGLKLTVTPSVENIENLITFIVTLSTNCDGGRDPVGYPEK